MMIQESIFTKIVQRSIPATIVFETEDIIAIRDIAPKAPVHILVIPKKQIPTINDISAEDTILIGKIIIAAKDIAVREGIAENGYRLIFNCNEYGGQTVWHIHCHLLGGKKLGWSPD